MKMISALKLSGLVLAGLVAASSTAQADQDQSWVANAFKSSTPTRGSMSPTTPQSSNWGGGGGETGVASFYWQPQRVASGGTFNPNALTAAHKTLPFGTRVRVTSLSSGRSVVVTINDRGPFVRGRIIDLSRRAAQDIGMTSQGVARVSVARI